MDNGIILTMELVMSFLIIALTVVLLSRLKKHVDKLKAGKR